MLSMSGIKNAPESWFYTLDLILLFLGIPHSVQFGTKVLLVLFSENLLNRKLKKREKKDLLIKLAK